MPHLWMNKLVVEEGIRVAFFQLDIWVDRVISNVWSIVAFSVIWMCMISLSTPEDIRRETD